jgi:hypothetical protein
VIERERLDLPVPAWNRQLEVAFYDDFMEISGSAYSFSWLPYPEAGSDLWNPVTSDSTLHRRYVATPSGSTELLATGVVSLVFRRLPAGTWVLVEWRDQPDLSRGGALAELLDLTISQRRLEAYDAAF